VKYASYQKRRSAYLVCLHGFKIGKGSKFGKSMVGVESHIA